MNRPYFRIVMLFVAAMISSAMMTAQPAKKDAGKATANGPKPAEQTAPQPDPVQDYLRQPTNQGYLKARAHLDTLLAKDPKDYKSLVLSFSVDKAGLDVQVGKLYDVRDSLDDLTKLSLANFLLDEKSFDRAVALYDALTAKSPKWSDPWRGKGQALYEQGRLDEAEKSLLKAVEARDARYDAYMWLAKTQRDLKRCEDALETLKKGFALKYKDAPDPTKDLKVDDDIRLMDELLQQNMVQPDQVAEERNKIIRADSKPRKK